MQQLQEQCSGRCYCTVVFTDGSSWCLSCVLSCVGYSLQSEATKRSLRDSDFWNRQVQHRWWAVIEDLLSTLPCCLRNAEENGAGWSSSVGVSGAHLEAASWTPSGHFAKIWPQTRALTALPETSVDSSAEEVNDIASCCFVIWQQLW